ncbi:MAG TPA: agmatinase [bacterium (Candidatus Stahlbacteria)]|nr:agmatinase [Candidatus Stahlbacteria bacterium]
MARYPSYQFNFGSIEDPSEPEAIILPIPYSYTASYGPSVREGPERIISVSKNLEVYDEELLTPLEDLKIRTLPFLEPSAVGPLDMIKRIEGAVAEIYNGERLLVPLGGEHTITIGVVKALKKRYDDLSILILDAHDDLRQDYESSPYSHACVSRRLAEICPVLIIGVRSISTLPDDRPENLQVVIGSEFKGGKDWRKLVEGLKGPLYISCDFDVFDPSVMASVGSPEPDGLYWSDVTAIIRYAIKTRDVICTDFVELAPIPGMIAPDFTAAKLIMRTIGYWCCRSRL